jgi:protein-L-isoaspartate(D-aspartate) O-methyltransferase
MKEVISWHILPSKTFEDIFDRVDRADFLHSKQKDDKLGDYPIPIGYGQTNSQPTTVAFMLELLQPRAGDRVLDIGSGSGWTTALLAEIVGEKGKVFGVEIVPELTKFGQENLSKYDFKQATIHQADKNTLGFPSEAPFDKILVSAAAKELPEEFIDQLKVGGRLVVPIKNSVWRIDKTSEKSYEEEEFPGFAFVPLKQ